MTVVVWARDKNTRAAIDTQLRAANWCMDLVFCDRIDGFRTSLSYNINASVAVIVESDFKTLYSLLKEVSSLSMNRAHVFLGVTESDQLQAFLGLADYKCFPLESLQHARTQILRSLLLTCWNKSHLLIVDKEIKEGLLSGFIGCVSLLAKQSTVSELKERAHLAHAIALYLSDDLLFRQRVVRLALASDLAVLSDYAVIMSTRTALQCLKDLLRFHSDYLASGMREQRRMPSNTPLELAIVELAYYAQKEQPLNAAILETLIETSTSDLPYSMRSKITQAAFLTLRGWAGSIDNV